MTLRDQILGCDDRPVEKVNVPEWGVTVNVQAMTGGERGKFEQLFLNGNKENQARFRALLAQATVRNDDGSLVFDPSDVDALQDRNASALDRISEVALRLSGITKEEEEQLAGNSSETTASSSG